MWTLSTVMETVHHKRAQCGLKQPRFPPCTVPLLLHRPRLLTICRCVYTRQPGNCNVRNISYRRRQLRAVTLWISLTWILSFRRRPGEISSLSAICASEMLKAQRPLFQTLTCVEYFGKLTLYSFSCSLSNNKEATSVSFCSLRFLVSEPQPHIMTSFHFYRHFDIEESDIICLFMSIPACMCVQKSF